MVRIASRLGIKRVAHDITPPLHEYLRDDQHEELERTEVEVNGEEIEP